MASKLFVAGAAGLADRSIDFASDTIKVLLLETSTPYTFDADQATITAVLAAGAELNVTGYAPGFAGAGRQTLAGKTITADTANDRVKFDATDPAPWTLASGKTVAGAVIYKHLTNDGASIPIAFLDPTDLITNGGTATLQFHADGCFYQQL